MYQQVFNALNALGLSTQVPLKAVYLTDGAARIVKVGKRTIQFKRTTPKNLSAKGQISKLVIQALKAIGKDKVSVDEERKILALLRKEKLEHLKHDILLAPEWIRKIMRNAQKNELLKCPLETKKNKKHEGATIPKNNPTGR